MCRVSSAQSQYKNNKKDQYDSQDGDILSFSKYNLELKNLIETKTKITLNLLQDLIDNINTFIFGRIKKIDKIICIEPDVIKSKLSKKSMNSKTSTSKKQKEIYPLSPNDTNPLLLNTDESAFMKKIKMPVKLPPKEILSDNLILNVIRLYNKMIKFDILSMLDKKEHYTSIVQYYVKMIEYDPNNPKISKLLVDQRGMLIFFE